MTKLWLDLETFSEMPIANGTYAYAENAQVLLFAYAIDDDEVSVWDCTNGKQNMPDDLRAALKDATTVLCAHNSMFDRTVLRYRNYMLPIQRWHDTMVKALAHSLPGSLGTLCEILGVPTDKAKDKEGRQLINLFCKPQPAGRAIRRATSKTHPEQWTKFIEYARLDIEAMREVDKRLPSWNYQGEELILWHLDQTINDRGVMVDTDLANAAIRAVTKAQAELAQATQKATGGVVKMATQRGAMLTHILAKYDITLPDMTKSTLERRIADESLPIELRELLGLRLQASSTSTAKYKTLARAVNTDGRLRGTLQFDGASRTGRWAGRTFQPQNLPRPTLKQNVINLGIDALKADAADLVFSNIMELTSSAVRGCIIAPEGKKLVIADLSNIEGRCLAWLAGEEWKLEAFRAFDAGTGPDLYALAYAKSFGVTPETVMENKKHGDGSMRQIGKVMELMLGYEGGVGAYVTGSEAYGIDLEAMAEQAFDSLNPDIRAEAVNMLAWTREQKRPTYGLSDTAFVVCDAFKRSWRYAHPATAAWWGALKNAAIEAIEQPGKQIKAGRVDVLRSGNWLRIRLPSGRQLCYPSPRVDDGAITYKGMDQYTRKWSRLKTYGGKLAENITQAVARDVLATSMAQIEASGYQIVLTVHDEIISETPDNHAFNSNQLAHLMATNPHWAEGLPLAAAGFEAHRYRKE